MSCRWNDYIYIYIYIHTYICVYVSNYMCIHIYIYIYDVLYGPASRFSKGPRVCEVKGPENVSLERAWCSVLLVGFTGLQLWAVGGQEQSFRALY